MGRTFRFILCQSNVYVWCPSMSGEGAGQTAQSNSDLRGLPLHLGRKEPRLAALPGRNPT
jgi:hypothetical protein